MASGIRVRLTVPTARQLNAEIQQILKRKAESVTKNPDLRKFIGQKYIEAVTPYVPMKTGKLREQSFSTNDGRIVWSATSTTKSTKSSYNYADIQYEPEEYGVRYVNYTTPGTHAHWTDYVTPPEKGTRRKTRDWENVFIPSIRDEIIRVYKNG